MKKIPNRFFKGTRLEIGRILVEELTMWESTKKVSEEEFCRLVDRLLSLVNQGRGLSDIK